MENESRLLIMQGYTEDNKSLFTLDELIKVQKEYKEKCGLSVIVMPYEYEIYEVNNDKCKKIVHIKQNINDTKIKENELKIHLEVIKQVFPEDYCIMVAPCEIEEHIF